MDIGEVSQQKLSQASYEEAIDACKWIAAKTSNPLEREIARLRVLKLRVRQLRERETA